MMALLSFACNFAHSLYCSKKFPCSPKIIFPIDHHDSSRVVCKTHNRTPRNAKTLNWDSFYYEFLMRFYICKTCLFVDESAEELEFTGGATVLLIFSGLHYEEIKLEIRRKKKKPYAPGSIFRSGI